MIRYWLIANRGPYSSRYSLSQHFKDDHDVIACIDAHRLGSIKVRNPKFGHNPIHIRTD